VQPKKVYYKMLNNLFPPHSFKLYNEILSKAQANDYSIFTLKQFSQLPDTPHLPFLILRHDIDSDAAAALLFAEIEKKHNCVASYFFRRCTWNERIISIISRQGHELGYHFEEMTDFAKAKHLKTKAEVLPHVPEIQQIFAHNLLVLRQKSGLELSSMAAHGDFAWKILDLGNRIILKDDAFRAQQGICYEAYDEELVASYGIHISDNPYPERFHPYNPLDLIGQKTSFLLLTHPRWWHPNPIGNFTSDLRVKIQKLLL